MGPFSHKGEGQKQTEIHDRVTARARPGPTPQGRGIGFDGHDLFARFGPRPVSTPAESTGR